MKETSLYAFGKRNRPDLLRLAPLVYRFAAVERFPLPRRRLAKVYADINNQLYLQSVLEFLLTASR